MSEFSELVRQRGSVRSRLTLFEKYLLPLLDLKSNEINKTQINELSLRLNKAQDISYNFDEIQSKIEQLKLEPDEIANQMNEREITENKIFKLIAQAQSLLESWKKPENSEEGSNCSSSCHTNNQNVRLPPLKIPSFDGSSNKWLEFRDMYLSLIHNNDKIDEINKFHYLKSYLEGAASSVINSVTVSSKNYSIAWSLLCERYDNKRLLINEHLKCLFSIETMNKESDKGIHNLIDILSRNLHALNSLGEPTDNWDTLIIYMASAKLDTTTLRKWEEFRSNKDSPKLEDFYSFLRLRANVLETLNAGKVLSSTNKNERRQSLNKSKSFIAATGNTTNNQNACILCTQDHRLHECQQFKSLPLDERNLKVNQWKLCGNCLRSGHQPYQCRLSGCRICNKKHNTLLHRQQSFQQVPQQQKQHPNVQQHQTVQQQQHSQQQQQFTKQQQQQETAFTSLFTTNPDTAICAQEEQTVSDPNSFISLSAVTSYQTLLSTALVEVTNNDEIFILRALLDSGSQSSFISEAAQKRIGFVKSHNSLQCVSGLNNNCTNITEHCNININSLNKSFNASVKCYIIPVITDKLPHATILYEELSIPSNIKLADPKFYQPSEIDLLLGADIFWDLIGTNRLRLGMNMPILQETQLGWIVSGPMGENTNVQSKRTHCHFSQDIQQQLTKFWELEELPSNKFQSKDDDYCEQLFNKTTTRDDNGRFCVQIPLRESPEVLGDSYNIAEKRLLQIERKLNRNPVLQQEYTKFINEYESLGHLVEVAQPEFGCYLPHHAVIREQSETTKVRVVFDASAKTSSGKSFNDIQYVGPVVQEDLFSILLRFRQHRYVVSADVEKMYRQILVDQNQRHLQMILWRDDDSKPIKIFQLNTVTYGTASAPYLSTRCLLQLSIECADPKISQVIKEDFYVDDFLSGGSTTDELKQIVKSVTNILQSACLPLRKFRTNEPSSFADNVTSTPKDFDLCSQSNALGLKWNPSVDVFEFPVHIEPPLQITKRSILSNSAKLFDPLGLLGLCTIIPKIIIQKLWLLKLDWDDVVNREVEIMWNNFVMSLNTLATIRIPRQVFINDPIILELHSFSDASEAAYAACIYVRSIDCNRKILVRLLCAKTKVAPLKLVTIPRLELCAAHLSSRLTVKVLKALRCKISKTTYWTDSSVVLSWISSQPSELQTFVANRVSEIQQHSSSESWRHVPGKENPADLASRGLEPNQINKASLWWNGPTFLLQAPETWPRNVTTETNVPERKTYTKNTKPKTKTTTKTTACSTTITTSKSNTTNTTNNINKVIEFEKYSKFTKLLRTMAYILRFIFNARHSDTRLTGPLTCEEIKKSLNKLIQLHQRDCFSNEILIISSNKGLPNKSHILSLSPFVDEAGILRVGGRIQNSSEKYTKKHPALLESNHNFTKLLFMNEHLHLLHCGPQSLLNSLRENYWPLRGRILARKTINNCKTCRILKANSTNPIMGNLPTARVTPNLPFQVSGVDFAGPFFITDRKGRGCRISKCYLCLFICLATKATHLELASDLSSDIFILCLRRFISRRGKPSDLYCDNGTNFVGTNNEISNFLKSNKDNIASFSANEGIKFVFSPPYAPHFGGLWEAGIKSAKFHMTRTLGNQHFTFEELSTLFTQIEAVLNSRPLTPLTSDPNDLCPLTPGHFLIGRALTSLPSPALLDFNTSKLTRYQHIEKMRQQFWERWRNEYLAEMQQRVKWKINEKTLQEGDMVVLKEANLPPLKWRMGRIQKLYPGQDGVSRVADINTSKGIIRRAINKLCPLLPTSNFFNIPTRNADVFEGGEDVKTTAVGKEGRAGRGERDGFRSTRHMD